MNTHSVKTMAVGLTLGMLCLSPVQSGAWWDSQPSYYNDGMADCNEINSIVRGSLGCRFGEPLGVCETRVERERDSEAMRQIDQQELGNFEKSIFDIGRHIDSLATRPPPAPRREETGKYHGSQNTTNSLNVEHYNCNTGNSRTGDAVNDFANGLFEDTERWERRQNGTYTAEDQAIDEHCNKRSQQMAPYIDAQLNGARIKADVAKRNLDRKGWEKAWEHYKTWKDGRRHAY